MRRSQFLFDVFLWRHAIDLLEIAVKAADGAIAAGECGIADTAGFGFSQQPAGVDDPALIQIAVVTHAGFLKKILRDVTVIICQHICQCSQGKTGIGEVFLGQCEDAPQKNTTVGGGIVEFQLPGGIGAHTVQEGFDGEQIVVSGNIGRVSGEGKEVFPRLIVGVVVSETADQGRIKGEQIAIAVFCNGETVGLIGEDKERLSRLQYIRTATNLDGQGALGAAVDLKEAVQMSRHRPIARGGFFEIGIHPWLLLKIHGTSSITKFVYYNTMVFVVGQ